MLLLGRLSQLSRQASAKIGDISLVAIVMEPKYTFTDIFWKGVNSLKEFY